MKTKKDIFAAGDYVKEGMDKMEEMADAISAINQGSQEIMYTSKTIDDIAFQTTILVFSAAMEATRETTRKTAIYEHRPRGKR